MNANKILAGMFFMASMSGMVGCASLTTTRKPMVDEKTEIIVRDGKTTTNTVTSVEMKPEYNYFGKALNAANGTIAGLAGGIWAGHKLGTETNGMENATFWEKTGNYFTYMGKGVYNGVIIGSKYGWNRSKEEEEKAAKEAALMEYKKKQEANSL